MIATLSTKGSSGLTIAWSKVTGAKGYEVWAAPCNTAKKKTSFKKVATIKGNKTNKWSDTGLKKHTAYKFRVKAYTVKDGKKRYIKVSPSLHAFTTGGNKKYTNAKSVKVNKTAVTVKKGKAAKIKASVIKLKKSKKLVSKAHAAKLRYLSTNKKVARVTKAGRIKGVGKGTCKVYVYAHNGVYKAVKVTVK